MRKKRELREGARYHVTARANRSELFMDSAELKALFITIIGRAKERFNFVLYNFCIMGNHFHFLIEPGKGESLSKIMHWIMLVSAITYNKKMGVKGHLWGDRYYSKLLNSFNQFLRVFRYIDQNPVLAKLVKAAKEWRHGGLGHFLAKDRSIVGKLPEWLREPRTGRCLALLVYNNRKRFADLLGLEHFTPELQPRQAAG